MLLHPLRLPAHALTILLAGLLMPAGDLNAQILVPDAKIQVRHCPPAGIPGACLTWQGAFQSIDGDSLTLRESSGVLSSIAWTPTTRVRVSRGRRGHVGQGALLGLVLGAVVGKAAAEACEGDDCGYETPILAGAGLALGSLIGAVARTERWTVVERPGAPSGLSFAAVSVRLPTRSSAPGIGFRFAF